MNPWWSLLYTVEVQVEFAVWCNIGLTISSIYSPNVILLFVSPHFPSKKKTPCSLNPWAVETQVKFVPLVYQKTLLDCGHQSFSFHKWAKIYQVSPKFCFCKDFSIYFYSAVEKRETQETQRKMYLNITDMSRQYKNSSACNVLMQ